MIAPEFRTCPISGRVVILAPERAARPMPPPAAAQLRRDCPLCPGMEHDTPPETYAIHEGDAWRLRVVPNKFPFFRPPPGEGLLFPNAAFGVHELLIETDRHCDPVELTPAEMARVVTATRDRLRAYRDFEWCRAVSAFRNVGVEAGASLEHPHSQLVALPFAPPGMAREWEGASRYQGETGSCAFCGMRDEWTRRVSRRDSFVAVCPFAPRFAYETWLMPARHAATFEDITDAAAAELGVELLRLGARLRRVLPGAAFNLTLHTSPVGSPAPAGWHWHFKLLPRTSKPAGFEWATECFVNPVPPELAARRLRET